MPSIAQLIRAEVNLTPEDFTKTQVNCSLRDKRIILSAVADDGIFTYIIRHAYKRTAAYIIANDIKSYDPAKFEQFLEFIRNGTDPRVDRHATDKHVAGATSSGKHEIPSAPSKLRSTREGSKGRSRKPTKEGKDD